MVTREEGQGKFFEKQKNYQNFGSKFPTFSALMEARSFINEGFIMGSPCLPVVNNPNHTAILVDKDDPNKKLLGQINVEHNSYKFSLLNTINRVFDIAYGCGNIAYDYGNALPSLGRVRKLLVGGGLTLIAGGITFSRLLQDGAQSEVNAAPTTDRYGYGDFKPQLGVPNQKLLSRQHRGGAIGEPEPETELDEDVHPPEQIKEIKSGVAEGRVPQ